MKKLCRSITLVLLSVSISAVAETPDQKTTSQKFKDWEAICVERAEQQQCRATQTLVNQQGQTVAVLNWYRPDIETSVFELALPLMINLKAGAAITVDENQEVERDLSFCNNIACFVVEQQDTELLEQFKKGSAGRVTFTPVTAQQINLAFSLQGFSAAFNSLQQ